MEANQIPVTSAPFENPSGSRTPLEAFRLAAGSAKLFRTIRRDRPSIVHFFLPGPYLAGAPAAIAAQAPIKIMSRRSLADYQSKWPGVGRIEHHLHRRMDAVIGNARAVVQELAEKEGCPQDKLHLIYNGIASSGPGMTKVEARRLLRLPAEGFVATMVANLYSYKGHTDLIAALAGIADQLPQPWVVLCAGRDAGAAAAISRAIAEKGLGEHVRLLGERSDVATLLAASDIGILSSTANEGFSNAILESMVAGLPMVVTDIGGNAEAVVDGVTGLVVPACDPAALGAAILKLACNRSSGSAMGERARERVREHFSLSVSVDRYVALYDELLSRKSRALADR